jgi:outer membrane protein OmpA-like peptidoglycan-associated protein
VFLGLNYNLHSGDFSKLKDIPNCCPEFKVGSGYGFNGGLLFEKPISKKFWFGNRLEVITLGGLLSSEETTQINTPDGSVSGIFEHTIDASFINLSYDLSLIFRPSNCCNVFAGISPGLNISQTFEQSETIISPENYGTFIDEFGNDSHSRTRNEFSGDIPEAIGFQLFFTGGVSYELPLNQKNDFQLVPEFRFMIPVTEFAEDTKWNATALSIGIAAKYSGYEKEEIRREIMNIDTVRIEKKGVSEEIFVLGSAVSTTEKVSGKNAVTYTETVIRTDTLFLPKTYALSADIEIFGVDKSGIEVSEPKVLIEEYTANRLDPLLNFIFFEEGSAEIPARYAGGEGRSFNSKSLIRKSTLEIYYNLLNIIAERMRKYPDANLTIRGYNSGTGIEKGNIELSKARAEAVQKYLTEKCGISEERLIVDAGNLSPSASTPATEDLKQEENRRVELESNDYRIMEPIFIEKTDRTSNTPVLRYKLYVDSEIGISEWSFTSNQENSENPGYTASGFGDAPDGIDWILDADQSIIPDKNSPLITSFVVQDEKGNRDTAEATLIPVSVKKIEGKKIEKFSLILFDFNSSELGKKNREIIEFIKNRISPNSKIDITGYSDNLGEAAYNEHLSEKRASAVKKMLGIPGAETEGKGESLLLYDNDLPEGRFYCRTVHIIVSSERE